MERPRPNFVLVKDRRPSFSKGKGVLLALCSLYESLSRKNLPLTFSLCLDFYSLWLPLSLWPSGSWLLTASQRTGKIETSKCMWNVSVRVHRSLCLTAFLSSTIVPCFSQDASHFVFTSHFSVRQYSNESVVFKSFPPFKPLLVIWIVHNVDIW